MRASEGVTARKGVRVREGEGGIVRASEGE